MTFKLTSGPLKCDRALVASKAFSTVNQRDEFLQFNVTLIVKSD
jgi:hypothetical protein